MSKIIELVGGSGCGKTYLLNNNSIPIKYDYIFIAGKYLSLEEYKNKSRLISLFEKIIFSRKFLFSYAYMKFLFDYKITEVRMIINLAYKLKLSFFLADYSGSKIILIEEGPTQLIFNNYRLKFELKKVLPLKNFSSDIIFVKCNFDTQYKRLKKRGHWRIKNNELKKFVEFNQNAANNLEIYLNKTKNLNLLYVIDNN